MPPNVVLKLHVPIDRPWHGVKADSCPYSRLHGGGGCLEAEHVLLGEPAIRAVLCGDGEQKEGDESERRVFLTQALQSAQGGSEK